MQRSGARTGHVSSSSTVLQWYDITNNTIQDAAYPQLLLAAINKFDPGPPPSLTSDTYLRSLAETETHGSATSSVRTPQETDVALFWEPAINIQYIQIVRAIIADTPHSLAWDPRFVAAFQVVTTDAQIAIYNAKYKYVFWRPVTAIGDGSPGVTADPNWTPLFTTPPLPGVPERPRRLRRCRPAGADGVRGLRRAGADQRHQPDRSGLHPRVRQLGPDHPGGDQRPRLGGHPLPLLRQDRRQGRP